MKRIDARIESFHEEFESVMTERMWSANKVINHIVRTYFTGQQREDFYKSEIEKKNKELAEMELKLNELKRDQQASVKKPRAPAKRFAKPEWQELAQYFHEQGSTTCQDDATRFIDYYESNGWKVGKNSMKDWKATVRQWIKRKKENEQQNRPKAISGRDAITFKDNDF